MLTQCDVSDIACAKVQSIYFCCLEGVGYNFLWQCPEQCELIWQMMKSRAIEKTVLLWVVFFFFVLNTIRLNISWNGVSSGCLQLRLLEIFPIEHMAIGRCWFLKSETLKTQQFQWFFFLSRMICYNQVNTASQYRTFQRSFYYSDGIKE